MRSRAVAGMVVGYWGCASTILLGGGFELVWLVWWKGGRGKKEKKAGVGVVQFVDTEGV